MLEEKPVIRSNFQRDEISRSKIKFSLDYTFGKKTSNRLDTSDLKFEYSRRTGRLRFVKQKSSGKLLFTLRQNGSIAPSLRAVELLLGNVRPIKRKRKEISYSRPRWTITVRDGVSEFISRGKTVFCKHVIDCDDSLRAAEDVAILNENGVLLAVGKTILAGPLMKQFKRGAAVKVREGVKEIAPAVA